jgi:hypothetical protein
MYNGEVGCMGEDVSSDCKSQLVNKTGGAVGVCALTSATVTVSGHNEATSIGAEAFLNFGGTLHFSGTSDFALFRVD